MYSVFVSTVCIFWLIARIQGGLNLIKCNFDAEKRNRFASDTDRVSMRNLIFPFVRLDSENRIRCYIPSIELATESIHSSFFYSISFSVFYFLDNLSSESEKKRRTLGN